MAYSEFYINPSTGSNLNAGSDAGSPSMSDTAGTGSWTSTTNIYISVATTGTVTVGQYLSLYQTGATVPAYVSRIITVTGGGGSAWTITVTNTGAGAKPTTGATFFAQVGGAWAGPSGTVTHPFPLAGQTNLKDANGDPVRFNYKNNATYAMTAAITTSTTSPGITHQGYTTSPGDGGKATLIGPTTGTSYIPLTLQAQTNVRDFIVTQNGATGTANGIVCSQRNLLERVVVYNIVGAGVDSTGDGVLLEQCEITACNTSNTTNTGGVLVSSAGCAINRCVIHHNSGSNVDGVYASSTSPIITRSILANNGRDGVFFNSSGSATILDSWVYSNTGDGIHYVANGQGSADNCVIYGNTGDGINNAEAGGFVFVARNCAFGSNAAATAGFVEQNNSITLSGDPSTAGSTGNFALNATFGALCKAAGIGAYTMTQTYTTPTTGSVPDVGGVQGSGGTGSSGGYIIGG